MSRRSILVVEDEKDVRELLRYNLEKEGYGVWCAETGEEGLSLAKSKKPSAILLDLMLPSLGGLEVCRLLKAAGETKGIPILMLTAKGSEVDEVVGLELGASDYLTKPFSVKIVLARLKNVLKDRESAAAQGNLVVCCGLHLDAEKHQFKRRDKMVDLTKTEFNILAVLMERPRAVVSRDALVSKVWGAGACVSSAAVNMQIKNLRQKLGRDRGVVETVRGCGFRFC